MQLGIKHIPGKYFVISYFHTKICRKTPKKFPRLSEGWIFFMDALPLLIRYRFTG